MSIKLPYGNFSESNHEIYVRRSLVDQIEGAPKTPASRRTLPLEPALAFALKAWQQQTSYAKPTDWVFASPYELGARPYWPGTVLQKVIQPAARSAGITKRIGWHTFRRTTATWLVAQGESLKTTQDTMGHSRVSTTMEIYAQTVPKDMRAAQARITALLGLETEKDKPVIAA